MRCELSAGIGLRKEAIARQFHGGPLVERLGRARACRPVRPGLFRRFSLTSYLPTSTSGSALFRSVHLPRVYRIDGEWKPTAGTRANRKFIRQKITHEMGYSNNWL